MKRSKVVFRSVARQSEETVAEYVTRLRPQANDWGFTDVDKEIDNEVIKRSTSSN